MKGRDERVQETALRKPKDEEGSTEIPVNVRKLLSSDGRGRGYIECVRGHITRKWKNFISLHIDMSKKEVLGAPCQAAQKSQSC